MRANLYIDKGVPLVSVAPETLTDGSQVWNIYIRGNDEIPYASEKLADEAFSLIAAALLKGMTPAKVI
jgi:hypothetical protein